MQRWLSWSKAHDWKSCVRLITDRGFESHPLRRKSHESKDSWDFLCVDLQSAYQTAFADQTAFAYQTAFADSFCYFIRKLRYSLDFILASPGMNTTSYV